MSTDTSCPFSFLFFFFFFGSTRPLICRPWWSCRIVRGHVAFTRSREVPKLNADAPLTHCCATKLSYSCNFLNMSAFPWLIASQATCCCCCCCCWCTVSVCIERLVWRASPAPASVLVLIQTAEVSAQHREIICVDSSGLQRGRAGYNVKQSL